MTFDRSIWCSGINLANSFTDLEVVNPRPQPAIGNRSKKRPPPTPDTDDVSHTPWFELRLKRNTDRRRVFWSDKRVRLTNALALQSAVKSAANNGSVTFASVSAIHVRVVCEDLMRLQREKQKFVARIESA